MFLNDEQEQLANDIAERLIARGETVAVAESTTGGLVSAALLAVAGASRYYAGGGVLYTLNSRTALAGVPAETYANYRGATPEMLATLTEAMRERLGATWCIAESGYRGADRRTLRRARRPHDARRRGPRHPHRGHRDRPLQSSGQHGRVRHPHPPVPPRRPRRRLTSVVISAITSRPAVGRPYGPLSNSPPQTGESTFEQFPPVGLVQHHNQRK